MNEAVIVAALRTAVGKAPRGALRTTRPDDMAAEVIGALMRRTPALSPDAIEDVILGCAVNSVMPAGKVFTTLEMKINFTRAVTRKTGTLTCTANIVHAGSRTATAEGRILDAEGKVYAHGTATCILFRDTTAGEGS